MQLKIVSLNMAGYKNWQERIGKISDYLSKENPDLVLLQEVQYDPKWADFNQASELNQLLEKPFEYENASISRFHRPSVGEPYREGLAILSRLPITDSEVLALTQQVDDEHVRIVQNIDVQLEHKNLKISNVHFSNNKYSVDQLKEFMDVLSKRKEKRIITGDFNIYDIHGCEALYKDDYLASTDFKSYVSFPSENNTFDYMLLPKAYKYQEVTTTPNLSDHTALSYVIEPAD